VAIPLDLSAIDEKARLHACPRRILEVFFEFRRLGIHFHIENGCLVAPHAAEAPAGGYDVRDDIDFQLVGRLQEVKVGTANQTAEFNGAAGSQVQMVTKRGTNTWRRARGHAQWLVVFTILRLFPIACGGAMPL